MSTSRAVRLALSLILGAAGLTGCGGGAGSTPSTVGGGGSGGGSTGGGSGAGKAAIIGLVTMGEASEDPSHPPANSFAEINTHPGVYKGAVIDLYWSQLEPEQGVFDDTALQEALASIAAYNAKYPTTPVEAKLRIYAGAGTPAWVISATGAVTLNDTTKAGQVITFTTGEFWTTAYQGFWRGLQAHLASEYDASPQIAEVAISSCSSTTGEPFITPHTAADILTLHQAGYTDALEEACLSAAPQDYAVWSRTPLDFTFNPLILTDSGAAVLDTTFPVTLMQSFRASLGARGVVANHGLDSPIGPEQEPIYAEFTALYQQAQGHTPPAPAPLEFQTAGPTVDWPTVFALGLTYHPTEFEIWDTTAAGGLAPLSLAQLQQFAAQIAAANPNS